MNTNQTASWVARDFHFPLLEGGPLYRFLLRVGLMKPGGRLPIRCAVVFMFVAWVPLLALSFSQGVVWQGWVQVPFLFDFAAYARFLVALPLLVIAEAVVAPRLASVVAHFAHSGVVVEDERPALGAAIDDALRSRDSWLAEATLGVLAYVVALRVLLLSWSDASTWQLLAADSGNVRTWAGWWYVLLSLPLFQLLVWRWVWRLVIWYGFLWRMSRLRLNLIPAHPDQAGGLGAVGRGQGAFGILAFALMAGPAGVFAREIFLNRIPLGEYKFTIGGLVVLSLCIFLGPLFMFSPHLIAARRRGLREYGLLATTYCRTFHAKWLGGERPGDEALLGTSDIQSLADLGTSYSYVSRMGTVPFGKSTAATLGLASLAPMLPLLTSVVRPRDIFDLVLKVLF